jgi:BirA family biotin operon repressor/biotin-[acetyl-CoA-carboxylase] ligase
VYKRNVVDSTQDEAFRLFDSGEEPPFAVVANIQTSGRGRHGRRWVSNRGGCWITLLLQPEESRYPNEWSYGFAAAVSVADLLVEYGIKSKIEWPNDIFIEDSKVAGVLVEARMMGTDSPSSISKVNKVLAVGVGLNVKNNISKVEAAYPVTNMAQHTKRRLRLDGVRQRLLEILTKNLLHSDQASVLLNYRAYLKTIGKRITVNVGEESITGIARGVDQHGALLLFESGKVRRIVTGEIVHENRSG